MEPKVSELQQIRTKLSNLIMHPKTFQADPYTEVRAPLLLGEWRVMLWTIEKVLENAYNRKKRNDNGSLN